MGPGLQGRQHPDHLEPLLFVVAVAEIEPGHTHALVDELACIFGRLGLWAV